MKCQCKPSCEKEVKTDGRLYHPGHNPNQPWNKGKKGSQVGWAKGLTKETDERVARVSQALMGHVFADDTRKKMSKSAKRRATPESMKRVARIRCERWEREGNPQKGRHNHWSVGRLPGVGNRHIRYRRRWYRSTWEVAFAMWLYANRIKFTYESRTFRLKPGQGKSFTYTPDFYLLKSGVYVDVKAYLTQAKLNQIRDFKKAYPSEHLILAMKPMLESMDGIEISKKTGTATFRGRMAAHVVRKKAA